MNDYQLLLIESLVLGLSDGGDPGHWPKGHLLQRTPVLELHHVIAIHVLCHCPEEKVAVLPVLQTSGISTTLAIQWDSWLLNTLVYEPSPS